MGISVREKQTLHQGTQDSLKTNASVTHDSLNTNISVDPSVLDKERANQSQSLIDVLRESFNGLKSFIDDPSLTLKRWEIGKFASDPATRDAVFSQADEQLKFSTNSDDLKVDLYYLRTRFGNGQATVKDEIRLFKFRQQLALRYGSNGLQEENGILPEMYPRPALTASEVISDCRIMVDGLKKIPLSADEGSRVGDIETKLLEFEKQQKASGQNKLSVASELAIVKDFHELRELYKKRIDPQLDS